MCLLIDISLFWSCATCVSFDLSILSSAVQACVTYAAALEKQACALASKLAQQDLEQLLNTPEQHAAAAALYRKAAGVYDYASEQCVSQLSGDKQADRCSYLATTHAILMTALFCCQHGMYKKCSSKCCKLASPYL